MKFLPLIWAGLRRKPVHPVLILVSMAFAAALAGLAMTASRVLPQGPGHELDKAVAVIAGGGFVMILFLTVHATAQAVNERGWEFALLRTLGFSSRSVLTLLFCEVAGPCLAGAAAGQLVAQFFLFLTSRLLSASMTITPFLPPASVGLSFVSGLLVALASMLLPALRLSRLNLAATLARGRHG